MKSGKAIAVLPKQGCQRSVVEMTKVEAPGVEGVIDIARVRSLYYVSESISSKKDIDAILDCVPPAVRSITKSDRLVVALAKDGRVDPAAMRHTCPFPSDLLREEDRRDIALRVMQTSKPLLITTGGETVFYDPDHDEACCDEIAFTVIPLSTRKQSIGFLSVIAPERRPFDHADIVLLTILARQVATAIENINLYVRIERLARAEERGKLTKELLEVLEKKSGARGKPSLACGPLLTDKEHQVLGLMAKGCTNEEIAKELWIGDKTVKTHVGKILRKLGKRNRIEAVLYALKVGLVDLETDLS